MSTARLTLETIEIASPCSVSWAAMSGTNRVRFCPECQLQVYNLSDMARPDAEAFLVEAQGRSCVRFFRRQDGTVLTEDCPKGLRALRRVSVGLCVKVAACVAFLFGLLGLSGIVPWSGLGVPVLPGVGGPGAGAPGAGVVAMGKICLPPAVNAPPGGPPPVIEGPADKAVDD